MTTFPLIQCYATKMFSFRNKLWWQMLAGLCIYRSLLFLHFPGLKRYASYWLHQKPMLVDTASIATQSVASKTCCTSKRVALPSVVVGTSSFESVNTKTRWGSRPSPHAPKFRLDAFFSSKFLYSNFLCVKEGSTYALLLEKQWGNSLLTFDPWEFKGDARSKSCWTNLSTNPGGLDSVWV